MSTISLHILVPGLLSPPEGIGEHAKLRPPVLEKFLSWAVGSPAASTYEQQLYQLTLLPEDTASAPYALLGEGLEPEDAVWMQAHPVHLKADLQTLLLFEGRQLAITPEEAESLVGVFNDHFAGQGMELIAPHPERWYLRLEHQPRLQTFPLSAVAGRSPGDCQPRGEDAGRWQALLTETQMLFHGSGVNRQRQTEALPTINGLWPHGAGRLREPLAGHAHLKWVAAEDVLALGAAQVVGAHVVSWDTAIAGDELRQFGDFLHAELNADGHAWLQALAGFEDWLDRAFDWMAEHRDHCMLLYPCQGKCFRLDGRKLSRFWHRPQPFYRFL